MIVKIIFVTFVIAQIVNAIKYRSKIVSQRVTYFNNSYVGFDVNYNNGDDEAHPYLIVKEIISPYNDLHLLLYTKVFDQPPNLLTSAPLSLCKLLHDDKFKKNSSLMQFHIPQIYSFDGKNCPIVQEKILLTPYMFPSKFTSDKDLGCGYMSVESRLLKCNDDDDNVTTNRVCLTLMKTSTMALIQNESCVIDDVRTNL